MEDQKSDDPEQFRIVGKYQDQHITFIVEYSEDELGELIWVVTAWHSTASEKKCYEDEIERA
ncbi:hypothetical protein L6R29_18760 [Myxococcota bacterium]|nr:hypothetical protein [Myxococcota bacterium]